MHAMGFCPCLQSHSGVYFCKLLKVSKTLISDHWLWNKKNPEKQLRRCILNTFRICVHTCVSCNGHEVSERRLKTERIVCSPELCPSLGGGWGHSTVASTLLFWGCEEDATSFVCSHRLPPEHCSALVLREAEASLMTSAGPQQSFLLVYSHLTLHSFDCLLHTWGFLCILSSWSFFKIEIGTHNLHVALFHLPLCKVHRGPWLSGQELMLCLEPPPTLSWGLLYLSRRSKSVILDCKDTVWSSRKEKIDERLPRRLEIINQ